MKKKTRDFIFELVIIFIAIASFIIVYSQTKDIWFSILMGIWFVTLSFVVSITIILILDRRNYKTPKGR